MGLFLTSLVFVSSAVADFPARLPNHYAISCVNVTEQLTAYIFEIAPREYGVDIPDLRNLTPREQLVANHQLSVFSDLPRLFPRRKIEIDRTQLPTKLIFSGPDSFSLDIDVGRPQSFLGGTRYVGTIEFIDTIRILRNYQVDCIQGYHGPLHEL